VNAEIEVLVVEDEASLRRSLTKYLERAGYTFECCTTAREALALAERLGPGIVIAEYLLPDANGAGLLEKLVRIVPDVAVILLSEYDFQAVSKDLAHVAVGSFLKKPFDLVEFETALSSARSKAKLMSPVDLEEKRELGFEGIFGCTAK
jgi:two-component system, NtrC family, C4-dicarboxylate transport response regulator DctD